MEFKGYVLEKPRVGAANSAFTASPDNVITNPTSYNAVYGTDEASPGRTEYLVISLVDGDLADAEFGWTKNEGGCARFDYDGQDQRFRPLPGSSRTSVGVLGPTSNTTRHQVAPPTSPIPASPYRVSVGAIGSGTTFPATLVTNDSFFSTPTLGTVQISLTTGNLNWNPTDLTTQAGQTVFYQRQSFFGLKESTGQIGLSTDAALLLNPIPGLGIGGAYQKPLIRFGFGLYLTPVDVANEGAFSANPTQGTFQWARDTGRLRFNSTDLTLNAGEPIYYDGVLFEMGKTVSRETIGTVSVPTSITSLPSQGADLIFRAKKAGAPAGTATFPSTSVLQDGSANFVSAKVRVGDVVVLAGGARRKVKAVATTQLTVSPPFPSVTGTTYTVEKKADIYQFTSSVRVTSLTSPGQADAVQVTSAGAVRFSNADQASYGPRTAEFVNGDLPIERGISLRLFRNPVDPNAIDPDLKDVSTFFPAEDATLADPIIGQPSVFLPVLPIDDASYPLTVVVEQGTGIFTGILPRLDVGSPPAGLGYTLDFDGRQLLYSVRRNNQVVTIPSRVAAVQLPDPLIVPSNAVLELNTGSGYVPLVDGVDSLLDTASGVVTLVSQQGTVISEGSGATVATLTTLQDLSADFVIAGVVAGDYLVIPAGSLEGVYLITSVSATTLGVEPAFPGLSSGVSYQVRSGKEVLADRYWQEIALVDPNTKVERIRSSVATELVQGVDYIMSPDLGLIQFRERMLALDEVRVTYASTSNPTVYMQERAGFLVRKELTSHATPTSSIPFNPAGRTVATTPAPSVYRGGRPQSTSQVQVVGATSTITFLPDTIPTPSGALAVSDALPHGAIVNPNESVYIDYYVYEALGGENTIQVLNPPINLAQVSIVDGDSSFTIAGDWTQEFLPNRLMRIDTDQLYYITGVTYNGTQTTVTIGGTFRDSFSNPRIYITSGDIRLTPPSYFILEPAAYDPVPRGMNMVRVQGDRSGLYVGGTVLYFSGSGFSEFYAVAGSKYNVDSDRTEVTLTQGVARQYASPTFTLRRSVRAILESTATTVRTSETPLILPPATTLADSILVFRQVEGSPGVLLTEGVDYKIDDSGKIDLAVPLAPNEEVSIFYTRYRFVDSGSLRASYTANVSPSDANGLLNQRLLASFTTYTSDSFFFRVETMTNFRAEVAAEYKDEAKSSAPSGGPHTSNASQPKLYEQGAESVFFTEGRLANEDIIARGTLLQYNDAINYLEDLLRDMDGRVVGDHDGKFLFDGTTGTTRTSFSQALNQIDDRFKLSDFPIDPTPPLFPIKYIGTYLLAYQPSTSSRFFPTFRNRFGYTVAGLDTTAATGDSILDFELKNLTGSKPTAARRTPRASVTRSAKAGDLTIFVDTTDQVDTAPYRPPFANTQKVVIQGSTGTFYVTQGSPLTIASKTSTSITFTAPLPTAVPIGSSVYLADSDTTYRKAYRIGFDVTLDVDKGYLLYVKPYPPYDGSVGAVPAELRVQTPNSNELLETGLFLNNRLTAPDRFPALDGKALDDDGDQRLPLINPSPARELGAPGYLETELTYLSPGGVLLSNAVAPFTGTGNLNGAGTVITLASGTFPSPIPQVGDLVRTLSGVNGASSFRRVSATTANSVTVDVAFTTDTGFSFLVTAAANLASGTWTTAVGTVLTDNLANFITAGIKPGHTVIITQPAHASLLQRRQVQSVDSATQVTLTAAFSASVTGAAYRISNSLSTYSDVGDMPAAPAGLLGILQDNADSEQDSIDNFYATILDDLLSPTMAAANVAGTTLTGISVDFIAAGVVPGHLIYIQATSPNQGFYLVDQVTGPTTLTVTLPFPNSGSVTFRVVSSFTASTTTLNDLLDIRTNALTFYSSTATWSTLASSSVPVLVPPGVVDASYFARGYTGTDFSSRVTSINARKTYLTNSIPKVEAALASSDRFYDKRYVWIDARINLEKGILVQQERAVADRIKAQAETLKQLTKLLAVE